MKSVVVAVFALLCAAAAYAGPVNTATIRGTVVDNVQDCYTCNLSVPHGCFLSINTGSEPVVVHIAAGTGESCTGVVVDDCIEVTGEVVNGLSTVMSYQVEATIWGAVDLCE
jgi:protein tyrosine phosphatase